MAIEVSIMLFLNEAQKGKRRKRERSGQEHTHRSIPAVRVAIIALNDLRIGGLEVLWFGWLNVDQRLLATTWVIIAQGSFSVLHG